MTDIDSDLRAMLEAEGYACLRLMPDDHVAGIKPFMFTFGICTKLDWTGYDQRWCYESALNAALALARWSGIGDPPGPWLKHKGSADRANPKLYDVIGINSDGSEHCKLKSVVDMVDLWST